MVSIMIITMLYLNAEKKNIVSSQSQLKLTQHDTVEIPMETFKKKPILIEPDERRYHINSTKVRYFNTRSPWDLKNRPLQFSHSHYGLFVILGNISIGLSIR